MPYFHNLQEIEIQVITGFSRMDFPTLISYTSPFLNQGLHGGIYIFYSDFNRTSVANFSINYIIGNKLKPYN